MKLLDKEKLEYNINRIAEYDLKNNNLFGSSYFVYQNGKTVLKKHFGTTDAEGQNKVDDNTIYRLASMTKPITSVAILILADRGLISLNDPVSKFLPEFEDIHIITEDGVDLGKCKKNITILHCLTHTSGFGSGKPVKLSANDRMSIYDTIKFFVNAGLDFEPFSKQAYSSFAAFDVLAAIVEKVTGQDYEEFLKNELFIPCDMKNTTFSPTQSQRKNIIAMHDKEGEKSIIGETYPGCVFEQFPCEHKLAGAGLVSTLGDYSNFAKMLLEKGSFHDRCILSSDTLNEISKIYLPEEFAFEHGCENWGLGVRVIVSDEYKYLPVGSFGWSGAYGSHFWVDVKNNICAVFMKNSRIDGGSGNASSKRFEKAVFDSLIV